MAPQDHAKSRILRSPESW